MRPTPAVSVQEIGHEYGSRTALTDLTFDVAPGEFVALLGPNGCGKTTLFRILATLMRPTRGRASVLGADVGADPGAVRRRIGVTFQSPSVDGRLSVRENLMHHGHLYGLRGRELSARIEARLEGVQLRDRAGDRVDRLSGGMRRRVEIAKSLLHEPDVLLMDEPSTGLDPAARRSLADLLAGLRRERGLTCLMTTHLMDEAEGCDRVAILDRGRLVALDAPSALKACVGGEVVKVQAEDAGAVAARIREEFGLAPQETDRGLCIADPRGHALAARLAERFGDRIRSITVSRPSLEDVFLRLTGRRFEGSGDVGG
ncbi:MAG: ABC transporter [Planctomycetota bacterium]|nr:MAG: ABC transporter [Planctomycetota bacterium]